jgi:hypothetical protein
MPLINVVYNRFIGGELSPLLSSRDDYVRWPAGCDRLENFFPLVQGPITRRPGTRFISEVKNSANRTWLIPFVFSTTTAYIIEAGDKYFRFYYYGQPLKTSGGAIYEIASPYSAADLIDDQWVCALKWVQTADVLYMVNANHVPQKLSRYGHLDWRIEPMPGWPGTKPGEVTEDDPEPDPIPLVRANPTAIALFRERLALARGQNLWISAAGAFEDFNDPGKDVQADDPISISIYSEQANQIQWLVPSGGLLVGTNGGEFIVSETTTVDPFGPANVKVTTETNYGSRPVQPVRVGPNILFVQETGLKVMDFAYNYAGDSYDATDATVAAEHITKSGLINMVYQQEPHNILWTIRADGELAACTYNKDQEMNAWHRHIIGDGKVESLAVIPEPGIGSKLYLIVKRIINGQTKRYVEVLTETFRKGDDIKEAFFLDSGVTVRRTTTPTTTITGLNHLEGETVAILADGGIVPERKVISGKIELDDPASIINVGLPYVSLMETIDLELPLPDGSARGRTKRIVNARFELYASLGGIIGTDPDSPGGADNLFSSSSLIEYRRGNDRMDEQIPPVTGKTEPISWPDGYTEVVKWFLKNEQPLPFTLSGVTMTVDLELKR